MNLSETIRERLGVDITAFAGTRAAGELPLSDEVINAQIAARLAGHPRIAELTVRAQEGDAVEVKVVPTGRFLPELTILARIVEQPDFPAHPQILMRWSVPGAGKLAMLAGPALAFFKALPPGIAMHGDRLVVDIATLLQSRGFGEVVGFIRQLSVHTRPGGFLVQFEIGI